jgi:TniQ/Bacterial regulatory helix-turn-helix protein, lysR family
MTATRTLPIRVAPLPGEALDSWLEALAYRIRTSWADLLGAVGLATDRSGGIRWMMRTEPLEVAAISTATGIAATLVDAITLARYVNTPLRTDPPAGTVSRAFPWGRIHGSRYCPDCLAETGGRWQLAWRLGWSFVCLEHRCLLADACPKCGGAQRRRALPANCIPEPGQCANPGNGPHRRGPLRCGGDLTSAAVPCFGSDHQVLAAQRTVYQVLDTGTATFGVYRDDPQPSVQALADVRAAAGYLLADRNYHAEIDGVGLDLASAYYEAVTHPVSRSSPGRAQDSRQRTTTYAGIAAVGITVALAKLETPSAAVAGTAPQQCLAAANPVELAALGPVVNASDQLRYRTAAVMSVRGAPSSTRVRDLVGRIPTMLWPAWSLRFAIPDCHQRQLRPALAALLLLVDTRLQLAEAAELLSSPNDEHSVSRILQLLANRHDWIATRAALGRLADYLADHDTPIDYQHRRQLDYTTLLPDKTWARICSDTCTPRGIPARARIVRCHLFERLSGLPANAAPFALDDSEFRTKTADYPQYLTPELAQALEQHCRDFLTGQSIYHEPPFWSPPADVFTGLCLPGPDPASVDIGNMHAMVRDTDWSLGEVGDQLGTTLDVIRHLCETHPAPVRAPATPDEARARGHARLTAKSALTPEEFARLYQDGRISLRDLAARVGVSRQTVAQLAREYGIPLHKPYRETRRIIEREWLYEQYVTERRALPDIAEEAGMSTANMTRWAKRHAIRLRSRGGPSHSANLLAASTATHSPELIRPALAGIGGWERLRRFAAASQHPTLIIAADRLGIGQAALVSQINRIESELGTKLLIRAERGRPMRLTNDGTRVVAVIRAYERGG